MDNKVFLRQVIKLLDKIDSDGDAVCFDIEFRTYNRHNKQGGVLKKYRRAKLLRGKKLQGKEFIAADHFYRKERVRKNPNHWNNRTRNIETATGRIVKVNIMYITKFNGLQVIY